MDIGQKDKAVETLKEAIAEFKDTGMDYWRRVDRFCMLLACARRFRLSRLFEDCLEELAISNLDRG